MEYHDHGLAAFLEGLAGATTPAGGSAAAVTGAMGAALCEMVCVATIADGAGEPDPDLVEARDELRSRRRSLLALAGEDAEAVEATFLDGSPDAADRERVLAVPLAIAEDCLGVLEAAAVVAERADGTVAVDAATGAVLANAGLRAAALTVRTNVDGAAAATETDAAERADAAETGGEEAVAAVLDAVGVTA